MPLYVVSLGSSEDLEGQLCSIQCDELVNVFLYQTVDLNLLSHFSFLS